MNHSLKPCNTFGIDCSARELVRVENEQQLVAVWQKAVTAKQPVLILGEGSNILFLEDYSGTVIINRIMGIEVSETPDAWHLHVGAGENWHRLVQFALNNKMPGLENLALIPGCAGSSPIQNIGAYGIELQSVCQYVDCVELATGQKRRFSAAECRFGYRDSIFKHEYKDLYAIVAVGLTLAKVWRPVLTYGDLTRLDPESVTPHQVFDSVCHMRMTKLPDPKVTGNAGSFFKNPVISAENAQGLLEQYPGIPHYPQPDGSIKLAAGWLIDQCQLKGKVIGGAAVHNQQALVLINYDRATSEDVVKLAHYVRQQVGDKFNIWLQPEVRFISKTGEVDAEGIIV